MSVSHSKRGIAMTEFFERALAGLAFLGLACLFVARASAGERILGVFAEPGAFTCAAVCVGLALLQFSARARLWLYARAWLQR